MITIEDARAASQGRFASLLAESSVKFQVFGGRVHSLSLWRTTADGICPNGPHRALKYQATGSANIAGPVRPRDVKLSFKSFILGSSGVEACPDCARYTLHSVFVSGFSVTTAGVLHVARLERILDDVDRTLLKKPAPGTLSRALAALNAAVADLPVVTSKSSLDPQVRESLVELKERAEKAEAALIARYSTPQALAKIERKVRRQAAPYNADPETFVFDETPRLIGVAPVNHPPTGLLKEILNAYALRRGLVTVVRVPAYFESVISGHVRRYGRTFQSAPSTDLEADDTAAQLWDPMSEGPMQSLMASVNAARALSHES